MNFLKRTMYVTAAYERVKCNFSLELEPVVLITWFTVDEAKLNLQ